MNPVLKKALKAIDDFEYKPGQPAPTGWENVDFGMVLPPTDTLAYPPDFSTSLDAPTAFTGVDLSHFSETDTQTSSPDFSSLSDAYTDFREDVLPLEPSDGDANASFDAYPPPFPLPSPTPTQYSLPSNKTIAPAFTDVFQSNAPGLDPLSSDFSQSSMNVVTPFVPNSTNPAARKNTFADWNNDPSYPPLHRPATLLAQPLFIPPPPGATYISGEASESFSHEFQFDGDMFSVHPQRQQWQGSIGPMRTLGREVRGHITPYGRPQVEGSSESGKENGLNAGALVKLCEILVPPGKSKCMLTLTDKLEAKYPRIDPSAFYFFKDVPSEFNCPVPGCTAVLQIREIKRHGRTHVQPDGKIKVSNGSRGSNTVRVGSFLKNVTDRAGQHTCPYCNRSLTRSEHFNICRHLSTCHRLKQLVADALEVFTSR